MVTHLFLSVTILAISAITVAHAGIFVHFKLIPEISFVLLFQKMWQLSCRYRYKMSERLSECHVEHHLRSGAIRKPSLPRKLCSVQLSSPAHWRWIGPIQLSIDPLQIYKTGNENVKPEPFKHRHDLIQPFFYRWRENTSSLKIKWSTGHMQSLNRRSTSIPFTVFIKGRLPSAQRLMNRSKMSLRKLFFGTSALMCLVPRSLTQDQGFLRAEAGWCSPWVYLMVQHHHDVQAYTKVCACVSFSPFVFSFRTSERLC